MAAAERRGELSKLDRQYAELRIYPATGGAGYYFVTINRPTRWYWKDAPGADHFCQADTDTMLDDTKKCNVQVVGDHARSLALWNTWEEFELELAGHPS